MKTRVITLTEAFDRQKKIDELFKSKNIEFQYRLGVDNKNLKFTKQPGFIFKDKNYLINTQNLLKYTNRLWIRFGEVAALMAHKSIWEELLNDESDSAYLICEDDCRFSDKFTFDSLKSFDPNHYDLLYLQAETAHYQNKNHIVETYPTAIWDNRLKVINKQKGLMFEGFAGYCLSKQGAKKLIDYVEANGYDGPIDNLVCHIDDLLAVCPANINDYVCLDSDSKYSFTHSGDFIHEYILNGIELQSKEPLNIIN
jgi:GR25 family glycosyltransferase involved in LPS biosynthesis